MSPFSTATDTERAAIAPCIMPIDSTCTRESAFAITRSVPTATAPCVCAHVPGNVNLMCQTDPSTPRTHPPERCFTSTSNAEAAHLLILAAAPLPLRSLGARDAQDDPHRWHPPCSTAAHHAAFRSVGFAPSVSDVRRITGPWSVRHQVCASTRTFGAHRSHAPDRNSAKKV